jgi:hypothetical protein
MAIGMGIGINIIIAIFFMILTTSISVIHLHLPTAFHLLLLPFCVFGFLKPLFMRTSASLAQLQNSV